MHSNRIAQVLLCVRSGEGCGEYNGRPDSLLNSGSTKLRLRFYWGEGWFEPG